ncbi:UNVERIFIED_ASMBLY: phage tail protein, partial [Cronobacter sakazakii]
MADAPQKVIVKSSRIDASILPPNFPLPYKLYVIQQTTDLKDIADASNGANELAYEATVKNVEQDATLDDHESRISGLRSEVDDHETRITANTGSISSLSSRVT